jgi:hypothetical protein
MAAGVNTSAALSGLNANLGSFFGAAAAEAADVAAGAGEGVDVVDDVAGEGTGGEGVCVVDCEVDGFAEEVMELAEGVSFLGGAGGGCNVSGRFVSRSVDGDDDAGDCEPGTRLGLVCSAVDTE